MRRIGYLCILIFMLTATHATAQVSVGEKGTLSGTVFGDYYWFAQSHDPVLVNRNGAWFRRIYLTYETDISGAFSSRLRLEMSSPGDFTTDAKMSPVVKDAYLKWASENHQILAGISSTPTWGLVEDVWGYRSVEKTPLDLFGFGSSRDFGLSFKGKLGNKKRIGYHFFVGNGNSNASELNRGKKLMFSLSYRLTKHLLVQGYADWNETADDPNATDSYTWQAFVGYKSDKFNAGALYAQKINEGMLGAPSTELDIISAFMNISLNEQLNAFARGDMMLDPYSGGESNSYLPMSSTAEPLFLVGGVDLSLHNNVHLMPNVEAVFYQEDPAGNRPDTDVIPRLTLLYNF